MSLFGKGAQRICAVAAAPTAKGLAALTTAALRASPTIELRLDWLRSDRERTAFLRWLKDRNLNGVTFVATCRRKVGGGKYPGDAQGELYWLMQAREAGCLWCDLEVETLRELPGKSVRQYAVPRKVLLSSHDFERMPDLPRVVRLSAHGEVDAIKIAAKARTIGESVRLLQLARRSKNLVVVPMGEVGLPARILALRDGSALAYAPLGEPTAPGQVSLREMTDLYRAAELTRRTRVYGVIGDPIGHSLSPLMHNAAFSARKVDAVYLPFLVKNLGDFLQAIPEFGIRGFSVTLPHKQTILKYLRDCEPLAAAIDAVNTVVVRRDGSLYGCNTDYLGILRALEKKLRITGSRVLVYGAGGSARAAALALAQAGANVVICARREGAAKDLARAVHGEAIPRKALRSERFDAIVNATPVGMHPRSGISPLAPAELHCRIVMDLIYRPMTTQLLKLARRKGITVVSGAEMFLAQGMAQWELWTGKRAPEALMRRAVLAALREGS